MTPSSMIRSGPGADIHDAAPRTPASGSVAADDQGVLKWLANDVFVHAGQLTLVVSATLVDRSGLGPDVTLLNPPPATLSGETPSLPFADASFSRIYLHRLARRATDAGLLQECHRLLRPDGSLLVVTHGADFTFAPLPAGGEFHLVRRAVQAGGFGEIELAHGDPQFTVLSARRKLQPRPAQ